MLVFMKEPMGYTQLEKYRIYGPEYCFGKMPPADIPFRLWEGNKNILNVEPYTKSYLENRYQKEFPDVKFKPTDLYADGIDFNTMSTIANLIGIPYIKPNKPTLKHRNALRKAILNKLDEEV